VFATRNPFEPAITVTDGADTGASTPTDGTTTPPDTTPTTPTSPTTPASPNPSAGTTVAVIDVYDNAGTTQAVVQVGSTQYNTVAGRPGLRHQLQGGLALRDLWPVHVRRLAFTLCEGEQVIK